MNVLITGGTGFIGGCLARALVGAGHRCRALVRPGSKKSALADQGVECFEGDLTDADSLRGIAEGISGGAGILGTFMGTLMPGLVLIGISLVAWRWPLIGGVLLIIMGGVFAVFFNQFNKLNIFVLGLVVAPVVVAGLLLLFTKRPPKRDTSTAA